MCVDEAPSAITLDVNRSLMSYSIPAACEPIRELSFIGSSGDDYLMLRATGIPREMQGTRGANAMAFHARPGDQIDHVELLATNGTPRMMVGNSAYLDLTKRGYSLSANF